MKGAVLFGSERLIIRSKDTVLTEKLTRCNCVVNAPFAQPMLLQLDQASMSVSVCVCVQTWMAACFIQRALLPSGILIKMSTGAHVNMHVTISAAITCVCSMCTQHHHALQSTQNGQVPCEAGYGLCIACIAQRK